MDMIPQQTSNQAQIRYSLSLIPLSCRLMQMGCQARLTSSTSSGLQARMTSFSSPCRRPDQVWDYLSLSWNLENFNHFHNHGSIPLIPLSCNCYPPTKCKSAYDKKIAQSTSCTDHHGCIDLQTTRCVHNDVIRFFLGRLLDSSASDLRRLIG